jgi:hypothetical protein
MKGVGFFWQKKTRIKQRQLIALKIIPTLQKNKQDAEAKAKEQTSDSQPKVLSDEDFSNPGEVAGSEVWSMSKNILAWSGF